jgi:hypothetical protein
LGDWGGGGVMRARRLQGFKWTGAWVVVLVAAAVVLAVAGTVPVRGMAQVPGAGAGRDGVYSRCNGFPYPVCVECAMGTRCDSVWSSGGCRQYARYEVCGYACVTGRSCASRWFDGTCRDWNVDAACGSTCSSEEVCDVRWGDGTCREYAVRAKCEG